MRSVSRILPVLAALMFLVAAPAAAGKETVFDASPDESGILVVDIHARSRMIGFAQGLDIDRCSIVASLPEGAGWDMSRIVTASSVAGSLVFTAKPGHYRLLVAEGSRMEGKSWVHETIPFLEDSLPQLTVEIRMGEVAYLGTVNADLFPPLPRLRAPKIEVVPNTERQQKLLLKLADKASKTPWGERLRNRASTTVNSTDSPRVTDAQQPPNDATLAALAPLARIERWVQRYEAMEIGMASLGPEELQKGIEQSATEMKAYLAAHPDDPDALILSVRLERIGEMARPVFTSGAGADSELAQSEKAGKERVDALAVRLDHALALQPGRADAYYWKARIYGMRQPTSRDGKFTRIPFDLQEAIRDGRRAVELAPDSVGYREALAQYLMLDGQDGDAAEVMRSVAGGQHPISLLLADRKAVPIPVGAIFHAAGSENLAQMQMAQGHLHDYPVLRVQMFVVRTPAAEVTAFYRQHWPEFQFFEANHEKNQEAEVRMLVQQLRGSSAALQPVKSKREAMQSQGELSPDGPALVLLEVRRKSPDAPKDYLGVPVGDVYCVLSVLNRRQVGAATIAANLAAVPSGGAITGRPSVSMKDEEDRVRAFTDSVMAAAPRAPLDGRNPEDRLLFVYDGNEKKGFIDTLGRIVVEPQYDWALSSSEGRAMVSSHGLSGYVDGTGRTVIEPKWQSAYTFVDGLAMVETGVKFRHNREVGSYREGPGVHGWLDRDGNIVISPKFADVGGFSEGVAWVSDGKRWGLIDRTGKYLIEPRFQVAPTAGFSSGLCPVWQGGEWNVDDSAEHFGYIDTTGATVIPARFRAAGSFSEGVAAIVTAGKLGFIDRSGHVTIEPRFECGSVNLNTRLPNFSEGVAPVSVNGLYGFVDKAGRFTIEPRFQEAEAFHQGLAAVRVDGETGFIDKDGTMIIAPRFNRVDSFEGGIARVEAYGGGWGYIRRDGSFIWPIPPYRP